MINVMEELTKALHKYTSTVNGEISRKEEGTKLSKFEELLEKYSKTVDDISFEYENMTDEELESAFATAFEESETEDEEVKSAEETEEMSAENSEETELEEVENSEEQEDEEGENFAKLSVNMNGTMREFAVSLQDKITALYELVNNTYADEDGCWYDVTVYDDDKYVIMTDWWSGKGFKQSYKVKKDVYTLVGDRVEVFSTWLTQDEINKLDKMKADYSEMSETLAHYEDEPKKVEILTSEDYSLIADNEEFVSLCEQENHFNMSVEEVVAKADAILTTAAKQHKFSTDKEEKQSIAVKPIPAMKKKAKRFGSLFDGII